MNKKFPIVACLAAAAMIIPVAPARATQKPSGPETLAEHLMTPLSLALGPGKSVLVTQNFAGTLDRVEDEGQTTNVYTNAGWDVGGVETRGTTTFFVESVGGGGGDPTALAGYLKSIDRRGEVRTIVDLATYERQNNPDGFQDYGFGSDVADECLAKITEPFPPAQYSGAVDSHPYATAVQGNTVYVADAGMNTILKVNAATGETSTLAVLPPRPAEATAEAAAAVGFPSCVVGHDYAFEPVPTDVEIGPDGWLYVSSLPGGPEDPSLGHRGAIFRVNPWTGAIHLWADEILSPTGIAVSGSGDVYAASMFGNEIVRIDAWTREQSQFLAVDGPAAVELQGNTLYATAGFSFADLTAGTVLKASIR